MSTGWSSCYWGIVSIRYKFLNILKSLTKIIILSKIKIKQILNGFENSNFTIAVCKWYIKKIR